MGAVVPAGSSARVKTLSSGPEGTELPVGLVKGLVKG